MDLIDEYVCRTRDSQPPQTFFYRYLAQPIHWYQQNRDAVTLARQDCGPRHSRGCGDRKGHWAVTLSGHAALETL
jgi:hypothetical protein